MKFLEVFLVALIVLFLNACAIVDTATRELLPDEKSTAPRVYYAGVEGLKLYAESSSSGPPIAELYLHEKVLRYKLENGFAYVKVPRTGQTGWVRNRHLVWRTGSTSKKKAAKSSPPKKAQKAEASEEVTPEPNPEPNQETDRRDASMFDAF